MARASKPAEPQTSQAEPTAPRPRDEQGYELDRHGLPLCLPARARKLDELGIADPALDEPADEAPAPPAPNATPEPSQEQ